MIKNLMRTWTLGFVFIAVLILHASRAYWQLFDPVFYGEEGRIFFLENHVLGLSAVLKTYAGYLHLFPRLVAAAVGHLDISKIPFWYHLSALIAHSILLYAILRFSSHMKNVQRGMLMFASILIPHGGEVFLNLPNTINILGPIPLLLYLAPKNSFQHRVLDSGLTLLTGLSGPYILIFLPFMILDFVLRRKGSKTIVCTAVTASLVQLLFMSLGDRAPMTEALSFGASVRMVTSFAFPLFFSWIPGKFSIDQMLGILVLAVGSLFWFFRKSLPPNKDPAVLLIAVGLVVWLAGLTRGLGEASWMHPFGGAQRYFWVPYSLIATGLVYNFSDRKRVQWVLVFFIFTSALVNWSQHIPTYTVKPSFQVVDPSGTVKVSVYPSPEWDFEYKP